MNTPLTPAEALLAAGLDAQHADDDPAATGWYGIDWLLLQARCGRSPFEVLVEAWLSTFANDNTVAAYRGDLAAWQQYCAQLSPPVDPLLADARHGDGFAEQLRASGADDDTRRRRLAAVSSCYRFAVKRGVRSDNPLQHTPRPANTQAYRGPRLTPAQVAAMVAAADGSDRAQAARDRVILRLLARCDVGVQQVCGLNYGHLQMHPFPLLEVRHTAARRQVIALAADVYDAFKAYLPTRLDPIEARGRDPEHTELQATAPLFYLQSPRLLGTQRISRGSRITRDAISTRLRAYAEDVAEQTGIPADLLTLLGPQDIRGVLRDGASAPRPAG